MSSKRPDSNHSRLVEARRELERAGFEVKRKVTWVKHSFQVDERRLKDFQAVIGEREVFVKDALDEALADWILKNLKPE